MLKNDVDKTVVESAVAAVVSGAAKVWHVTSGQDIAVVVASGQTWYSISGEGVVDVVVSGVVVMVVEAGCTASNGSWLCGSYGGSWLSLRSGTLRSTESVGLPISLLFHPHLNQL